MANVNEVPKFDSSSVDGTIVGTVVSDGTTLKSSDHGKYRHRKTRSINSRASTPAPLVVEPLPDDVFDDDLNDLDNFMDDEENLVKEVEKIIEQHNQLEHVNDDEQNILNENNMIQNEENLVQDEKNYLRVSPKKSPIPSPSPVPSKADPEEPPSFANTLDEIATIGTNEVADIDPSSQALDDRPESVEIQFDMSENIPVLNYNPPVTPPVVEIENEIENKEILINQNIQETPNIEEDIPTVTIPKLKQSKKIKNDEPSYESMGTPKATKNVVGNKDSVQINIIKEETLPESQQDIYQAASIRSDKKSNSQRDSLIEEEIIVNQVSENRKDSLGDEMISEVVARLSIGGGSSLSMVPSNHERQFTPLSFSSSDAQFYSPPDSPDSLSEKLGGDKDQTTKTQVI